MGSSFVPLLLALALAAPPELKRAKDRFEFGAYAEAAVRVVLELPGKDVREVRVTVRAGAETIVPGPGADQEAP